MNFTNEEELNKEKYPVTHWVMMGLKGNGKFNQSDSTFTYKSGDYDEKTSANIAQIQKRLKDYGAKGLLSHQIKKAGFTWSCGLYSIYDYITPGTPVQDNIFREFASKKGQYFDYTVMYANAYHIMMLLAIVLSVISSIKKKKVDYMLLLQIAFFGLVLFFMIWETRPRYLFNFTPIMLLLSLDGIAYLGESIFTRLFRPFKYKAKAKELKNV